MQIFLFDSGKIDVFLCRGGFLRRGSYQSLSDDDDPSDNKGGDGEAADTDCHAARLAFYFACTATNFATRLMSFFTLITTLAIVWTIGFLVATQIIADSRASQTPSSSSMFIIFYERFAYRLPRQTLYCGRYPPFYYSCESFFGQKYHSCFLLIG